MAFDNPKNITGMAALLADDADDLDIDLDAIEASITRGEQSQPKTKKIDYVKAYNDELEEIGRLHSGKDYQKLDKFERPDKPEKPDKPAVEDFDDYQAEYKPAKTMFGSSVYDEADIFPDTQYRHSDHIRDPQYVRMTDEQQKQEHISKVIKKSGFNEDDDADDFINQEDDLDEVARLTEQIDNLRTDLESEGDLSVARVPEVRADMSKKELKSILRILQIKKDRTRYCDFFEELVLSCAYGLEQICDGKRNILGAKIDLTGYSDTVKVKLKRMRYDTSTFVSNVMRGWSINSGLRIVLELIPSIFLYSRDRRIKANDNLISSESYQKAMHELNK